MFNYLKSHFLILPKLKKVENDITEFCYFHVGSPHDLKSVLITQNKLTFEDEKFVRYKYIKDQIKYAQKLFTQLPLRIQLEKVLNIELFQDSCTTLESYMEMSYTCRDTVYNYLLISYAEIIIPLLDYEQKESFFKNLEKSIITSQFRTNINSDYELKIIHAWKLNNDLTTNMSCTKVFKI